MRVFNRIPVTKRNPLDVQQRNFIDDRLREMEQKLPSRRDRKRYKPAYVRKAERTVEKWHSRFDRAESAARRKFEKFVMRVEREFLFGDVKKALAMLESRRG